LTGERTIEGFFRTTPRPEQAISRSLAYTEVADARPAQPPTTRYSTLLTLSDSANSLKSRFSIGGPRRIHRLHAQCLDGSDAFGHRPRQPERQISGRLLVL
jgi:hypothetical protein